MGEPSQTPRDVLAGRGYEVLDFVQEAADGATIHRGRRLADGHLAIRGSAPAGAGQEPAPTLAQRILRLLTHHAPQSLRRAALRDALRVNNAKLGEILAELEQHGFIARSGDGWKLAPSAG